MGVVVRRYIDLLIIFNFSVLHLYYIAVFAAAVLLPCSLFKRFFVLVISICFDLITCCVVKLFKAKQKFQWLIIGPASLNAY